MADQCVSLVRGKTLRATELDACALPVLGAGGWPNNAVSEGYVSVAFANEVDDGEEINQANANGDDCVLVPGCPRIKWINATIVFCRVDPWMFTKVTGWPLILDDAGNAVGFRGQKRVECEKGTALETWTGVYSAQKCDPAVPLPRYGYFLLPYLTHAYVSDFTIENGAINFTIVGKGLAGSGWGVGPYNVVNGSTAAEPLADPIDPAEDLYHFQVTTFPPPNALCGQYPRPFEFTLLETEPPDNEVTLTHTFVPSAHLNTIDWGDGSTSAGPTVIATPVTHVYVSPGPKIITVTDDVTHAMRAGFINVT